MSGKRAGQERAGNTQAYGPARANRSREAVPLPAALVPIASIVARRFVFSRDKPAESGRPPRR